MPFLIKNRLNSNRAAELEQTTASASKIGVKVTPIQAEAASVTTKTATALVETDVAKAYSAVYIAVGVIIVSLVGLIVYKAVNMKMRR